MASSTTASSLMVRTDAAYENARCNVVAISDPTGATLEEAMDVVGMLCTVEVTRLHMLMIRPLRLSAVHLEGRCDFVKEGQEQVRSCLAMDLASDQLGQSWSARATG